MALVLVLRLLGSVDAALWGAGSVVRVAWWGVYKVISWSCVLKRLLHFSLVGIVCLIAVLFFPTYLLLYRLVFLCWVLLFMLDCSLCYLDLLETLLLTRLIDLQTRSWGLPLNVWR
jgi:hypothetical protein